MLFTIIVFFLAISAAFAMIARKVWQIRMGKIAPSDVIRPKAGSQAFPLTAEEMNWQIEFFMTMATVSGSTGGKKG